MNEWQPTATIEALQAAGPVVRDDPQVFLRARRARSGDADPVHGRQYRSQYREFPPALFGRAGEIQRWLRTSPEFALKRLVAAGIGSCYELGRVFRNGEMGRMHNPEFSMLEWYRVGWTHHQLMDECAELVKEALRLAGRSASVRETSFRHLYQEHLGLDPLTASEAELRGPLAVFDIRAEGLSRDDWLDLLMTHLIQPSFPDNRILLVYDYPKSQAALARIRQGDVPVAERFELFLGPIELANGYHELNDPIEQRERFDRDLSQRRKRNTALPPVDERLLAALPALPDCAGVALGVDRLLTAMLGSDRIADTIAFPFDRA